MKNWFKNYGMIVVWAAFFWLLISQMSQSINPKTIEYIGDTPEGWKVYRVQGKDRPSGYVPIPPPSYFK